MPHRIISIAGVSWQVFPSGFVTLSDRDEFGLMFVHGEGAKRTVRLTRYSPQGSMAREQSLADLSEAQLAALFAHSQPAATAPETGYRG